MRQLMSIFLCKGAYYQYRAGYVYDGNVAESDSEGGGGSLDDEFLDESFDDFEEEESEESRAMLIDPARDLPVDLNTFLEGDY